MVCGIPDGAGRGMLRMADAEMNRIWAAETWKRMEEKLHRSLLKNGDKIL